MRVRALVAAVALPLLLWAIVPLASSGQTSKQQQLFDLQEKIDRARAKIGRKKGAERTLTSDIAGHQQRIRRLQGRISKLASRQDTIEADLDAKRSQLERLQTDLRAERARLVRLRRRLVRTRGMLRTRLIEIYKAGKPDLITVILNSDGFADLLERSEFIARISAQDREIVKVVAAAKADSAGSERRLSTLEERQQRVTEIVQERRDEVSTIKMQLIGTRVGYAKTKAGKAAALNKVRADRAHLQDHVDDLEAASGKIARRLDIAQRGNTGDLPVRRGSGGMIWPVNGPITGAFGEQRPGHIHAGIDIAAPNGTPIHAADDGKVVLMQGIGASGGYGNYTCVQHTTTMSTCYAHQSRFGTSVGAKVGKGQVIGFVGNTGHSFGNHLHFEVRIDGTPVQPLSYL
jgi:murein DD-endopeptidase MepM/ murein hydrolase activator NlpD